MKAVAAFLLVLCSLAISHAWKCKEGPRLYGAMQIDSGLGEVVVTDRNYYAYFLIGWRWYRMSALRFKHCTVGPAGLWATSTRNVVHKYVAGSFRPAKTWPILQVDAGGDDQVVGVSTSRYRATCLKNSLALAWNGAGSLSWNSLPRYMRYYSCGPKFGCWGVDSSYRVYVTKVINPHTCGTAQWTLVSGLKMKMIEVGTDGSVFGVGTNGQVYERIGITNSVRHGTGWRLVPMCMSIRHVSYDLGYLWVVTTSGLIMQCKK